jgi:hypothetical protein
VGIQTVQGAVLRALFVQRQARGVVLVRLEVFEEVVEVAAEQVAGEEAADAAVVVADVSVDTWEQTVAFEFESVVSMEEPLDQLWRQVGPVDVVVQPSVAQDVWQSRVSATSC